jgi:hypothetical protein
MKNILITLSLIIGFLYCNGQVSDYPIPPSNETFLFYLQHTINKNTVVYELNLKNKLVSDEQPVNVYWIRYSEKGQRQELNYLQRTFAYGMHSSKLPDNSFELNFVSNKKYKIYLRMLEDGTYHIYTTINKRLVILKRIFVNIIGGSAISPKVDYVEISGVDAITQIAISEKIKL